MPDVVKATFGGIIVGSQTWSVGINLQMATAVTPSQSALNDLATQLFTDFNSQVWSTTVTGAKAVKGNAVGSLSQVRTYYYPGGAGRATAAGTSSNAAVASTVTTGYPQIAVVATLQTYVPGARARGRMYLPGQAANVQAGTSQLSATEAQAYATSIANFLSLVRTRTLQGSLLTPIVKSFTGQQTAITQVRVDTVVDTQRRRRDKLVPTARPVVSLVIA